jgi:hypothetical protein
MKIDLDWQAAVHLEDGHSANLIYTCAREKLPVAPGIYVFGRTHGDSFEALYVGKATTLQGRIRVQFKNLPLMKHIENAKNGSRVVVFGIFRAHQKQTPKTCLPIAENALVRHFLERGDDIVNVHGARLKVHEIVSGGQTARYGIPSTMFVDQ